MQSGQTKATTSDGGGVVAAREHRQIGIGLLIKKMKNAKAKEMYNADR